MMNNEERVSYVLGHSTEEHRRLMLQSRFIEELTETLLWRAGLAEGMNVLDVGCGVGDVSMLAAAFVGPGGSVLGVDRSAESITIARQRVKDAGLGNIKFKVDDLEELKPNRKFDALVGRLILMFMEIDIDTLADRLREDVVAGRGVVYSPGYVGAWTRKAA